MEPGFISLLVGAGLCFVVPAVSFAAGVFIGRYGSPVTIRWRGTQHEEE